MRAAVNLTGGANKNIACCELAELANQVLRTALFFYFLDQEVQRHASLFFFLLHERGHEMAF